MSKIKNRKFKTENIFKIKILIGYLSRKNTD